MQECAQSNEGRKCAQDSRILRGALLVHGTAAPHAVWECAWVPLATLAVALICQYFEWQVLQVALVVVVSDIKLPFEHAAFVRLGCEHSDHLQFALAPAGY